MTSEEMLEVERRKTISIENKDELSKDGDKEGTQKKFVEFMMAEDPDQANQVKDKLVPGTYFSSNGVCEIN
jgi:hypothetical protein